MVTFPSKPRHSGEQPETLIPDNFMTRQLTRLLKRRGPAPKGAVGVMVRIEPGLLRALDEWIEGQGEPISRPAAIRKIVAKGLKVSETGA